MPEDEEQRGAQMIIHSTPAQIYTRSTRLCTFPFSLSPHTHKGFLFVAGAVSAVGRYGRWQGKEKGHGTNLTELANDTTARLLSDRPAFNTSECELRYSQVGTARPRIDVKVVAVPSIVRSPNSLVPQPRRQSPYDVCVWIEV